MGFGSGKVILLGEHAVVYGRPALAVGLDRGVRTTVQPSDRDVLIVPAWQVTVAPERDAADALARAFRGVLDTFHDRQSALQVEARVELPAAAGLGCSAALGVATVRGVADHLGVVLSDDQCAERAHDWERVFHGNPSGVDAAVSACGGLLLFRRGEPTKTVRPKVRLHLVIASSRQSASTHEMVSIVARQHERARARTEGTFEAIDALVRNAKLAVEAGDLPALGQLMDLNHALLSSLLVSTERLERLCRIAREAGALGAKLTGAGGGGCIVALAANAEAAERVREKLCAEDEAAFVSEVGP